MRGASIVRTHTTDYEDAAVLYRRCRRPGETVGKLIGCLIAPAAIRAGVTIRHKDADFGILARHTDLQAYEVTG